MYRKGETGGLVCDIIKVQFNDEKEGEEFFEKIKSAAEAEAWKENELIFSVAI